MFGRRKRLTSRSLGGRLKVMSLRRGWMELSRRADAQRVVETFAAGEGTYSTRQTGSLCLIDLTSNPDVGPASQRSSPADQWTDRGCVGERERERYVYDAWSWQMYWCPSNVTGIRSTSSGRLRHIKLICLKVTRWPIRAQRHVLTLIVYDCIFARGTVPIAALVRFVQLAFGCFAGPGEGRRGYFAATRNPRSAARSESLTSPKTDTQSPAKHRTYRCGKGWSESEVEHCRCEA